MLLLNCFTPPTHLEACPLAGETLVMQHWLQDFFVPARHQTYSTHDLQDCHLCLNVFCGQALGDDVDALGVSEDVGAALRVVHQSFDAADERRVDLWFCGVIVHAFQEVQDTRQAIQINKSSHKPEQRRHCG